jgi:hypothetical protein
MKFTAIYEERWTSGGQLHVLTKIARFECKNASQILKSEIGPKVIYIFDGHPLLRDCKELESEIIEL